MSAHQTWLEQPYADEDERDERYDAAYKAAYDIGSAVDEVLENAGFMGLDTEVMRQLFESKASDYMIGREFRRLVMVTASVAAHKAVDNAKF